MKSRPGIALVLALLTILLLQLLMAGVLAVATLQKSLAQTRVATARAQLAARAAPGVALQNWANSAAARLPDGARIPGPAGTFAGANYQTEIERVSGSAFLIRVSGAVGDWRAPAAVASAGFLVQTLDPDPIAASFPAALATSGPVLLSGSSRIDGASGDELPPTWTAQRCEPLRPLPASSTGITVPSAGDVVLEQASTITGFPAISAGAAPAPDIAGFEQLAARADHTITGLITPEPQLAAGRCDTDDPANWGATLHATHPCGDWFPVIHAPGDLQVSGGSGQGILLVEGDLTISGGTFNGLIMTRGRLTLRDGARIRGAVSTLNSTAPIRLVNASISRCECTLRSALLLSEAVGTPTPRPGRSWVPIY